MIKITFTRNIYLTFRPTISAVFKRLFAVGLNMYIYIHIYTVYYISDISKCNVIFFLRQTDE